MLDNSTNMSCETLLMSRTAVFCTQIYTSKNCIGWMQKSENYLEFYAERLSENAKTIKLYTVCRANTAI